MKHKTYKYNNIDFDSQEETEFAKWLDEAKAADLVFESQYHPEPFLLSDTVNIVLAANKKKCLFRSHTYKPDWWVKFTPKFYELFPGVLLLSEAYCRTYLDIKGGFNRAMLESDHTFRLNQKWVYSKFNIYVHKVVLKDHKVGKNIQPGFFQQTFVPSSALYCANRKILTAKKGYQNCKTLKEII